MTTVALSPQYRADAIDRLAATDFDVLVVGGGVVGAGSALDAVTRGLTTAVVEARDWASGTSSRSSKLIHGGLRYLEMLDFGLVREALRERGLLLQELAPHLVRPVPFLYPLQHRVWERAYVGSGVLIYDAMANTARRRPGVPRHRHLTRRQALAEAPALRRDALTGAVQYWDAQVDDARYTFTLVRTAASWGAVAANGVRVTGFLRDGDRVVGAEVQDEQTGRRVEVRARQVINATGVWSEDTDDMAHHPSRVHVRASKGIHLVVPRERIDSRTGMILRTEKSVLFVIPWADRWIIGTTDTDWSLDKADPAASAADVQYLLDHVNAVLASPLTRADVQGVYVGLRPLVAGASEQTTKLSREHVVDRPVPGLVQVAGGKYTTYRVMAADAVDEAVKGLGGHLPPSCTERIPLVGAEGYQAAWNQRHRWAAAAGLAVEQVERLLGRYGTETDGLLALLGEDPGLTEELPGTGYLAAEAVYAVTHEGARHLEDVLARRTRAAWESDDRGVAAAEPVAALVAGHLGWDGPRRQQEVAAYRAGVAAELDAETQPDDAAADAARRRTAGVAPA
ncbi:MAG TPA: glycerol-3-phosphate dehydrogenase/oxidase [Acidimicrobiales bacterium]|nr:glycerol-3-phosphate dehydrogenase/oxidase [Acidimicrobiales bacterium]